MLVVGPWHVEKLAPFKVSAELLNEKMVARHVCALGVPITRRLFDHQGWVAIAQDPADAEFLGQPEPVYECLILGHIVGGGEMDLQCVSEFVAFGR